MPKIRYRGDWPEEFIEWVDWELRRLAPLVAGVVDRWDVYFEREGGGEAGVRVNTQYRTCVMTLNQRFFVQDDEARLETLAHEVAHVVTDSLRQEVYDVLEHLVSDSDTPYAEARLDHAEEKATTEVGRLLLMILDKTCEEG